MGKRYRPICYQSGKCFGQINGGYCDLLSKTMTKFPCPFMKEERLKTNGVYYPHLNEFEYERKILNHVIQK